MSRWQLSRCHPGRRDSPRRSRGAPNANAGGAFSEDEEEITQERQPRPYSRQAWALGGEGLLLPGPLPRQALPSPTPRCETRPLLPRSAYRCRNTRPALLPQAAAPMPAGPQLPSPRAASPRPRPGRAAEERPPLRRPGQTREHRAPDRPRAAPTAASRSAGPPRPGPTRPAHLLSRQAPASARAAPQRFPVALATPRPLGGRANGRLPPRGRAPVSAGGAHARRFRAKDVCGARVPRGAAATCGAPRSPHPPASSPRGGGGGRAVSARGRQGALGVRRAAAAAPLAGRKCRQMAV